MGVLDFLFQGKPPPSTTTYGETVQGIPQFMSDYTQGLLSRANAVAGEPYQPYGGPRLATFSPEQEEAFRMTRESTGAFMPAVQSGMNLTGQAMGRSAYGAAQPYMAAAGMSAPSMVRGYMSPYEDLVAGRIGTLAGRNLRENLMPAINRDFIRAGQYGSSRMMDTIGTALRDTQESALAQQADLLNRGYGQAIGAAQTDLSRIANLGQLAGNLTTQDVNALLSGGAQMANLGERGQAMNLKDLAALEAAGQTQQGQAQKGLDIAYQDFVRQRDYPKEQLSMLNALIRGLPYGGTTSTSSTGPASVYSPSPLAQIAGAAALGSGLKLFKKGGAVRHYAEGSEGAVQADPSRWRVVDKQTGETIGEYSNRKRAYNVADKKDNEYGGYRHRVIPLTPGEEIEKAKGGKVRNPNRRSSRGRKRR